MVTGCGMWRGYRKQLTGRREERGRIQGLWREWRRTGRGTVYVGARQGGNEDWRGLRKGEGGDEALGGVPGTAWWFSMFGPQSELITFLRCAPAISRSRSHVSPAMPRKARPLRGNGCTSRHATIQGCFTGPRSFEIALAGLCLSWNDRCPRPAPRSTPNIGRFEPALVRASPLRGFVERKNRSLQIRDSGCKLRSFRKAELASTR